MGALVDLIGVQAGPADRSATRSAARSAARALLLTLVGATLATSAANEPAATPLRPPTATVPYLPATFVLDGFDGGTAFVAQSASGSVALDPAERVRVDAPTQLEHVLLYLSSDGFANHASYRVVRGTNDGLPLGDVQVSVTDVGSRAVRVWVDALEAIARPPRGVVSLVFDDARDGVDRWAAPLLERAGLRATIAVVSELVDRPGFMTLAALQRLERFAGWDVAAHHARPLDDAYGLEALSDEAVVAELVAIRAWLQRHGFHRGADHLAYPSGGFDARVVAQVRSGFASGRTIVRELGHATWPPVDPYRIRALSVRSDDTPEALAAEIARATREHSWLVLVFHQITEGPAARTTEYAAGDLEHLLEAISNADVDVRTFSELTGPQGR